MLVMTIENELNPRPADDMCNLVLLGIMHMPVGTVHVVLGAVVSAVGRSISSMVLVGSKEGPIVNGVDRVIVICE